MADRAVDPGDGVDDILFGTGFGGITDVKVGPDGYLYVLTFQDEEGSIFRIVPADLPTAGPPADADETEEAEPEEETTDSATADNGDTVDADETDEAEAQDEADGGTSTTSNLGQLLAERITGTLP